MKKKLLIAIPLFLVFAVVILFAVALSGGRSLTEGVILETESGTKYFVDTKTSTPIIMKPINDIVEKQIDGVRDGYGVLLLHDGVEETYPARTGAYILIDLKKAVELSRYDELISQLKDMEVPAVEENKTNK